MTMNSETIEHIAARTLAHYEHHADEFWQGTRNRCRRWTACSRVWQTMCRRTLSPAYWMRCYAILDTSEGLLAFDSCCVFTLKPTHRKHRTLPALRFARLAHIAPMQDQPMVGVDQKLIGNPFK